MTAYRAEIDAAAAAHGLDPDLVEAVVEQESAGHFQAYRYEPTYFARYLADNAKWQHRIPQEVAASFGLMQVMFPTAVEHGFQGEPWDLFNPMRNLDIGCTILAALMVWATRQYRGSPTEADAAIRRTALAAYNGGKGGSTQPGPQEYARHVLIRWDALRSRS